LVDGRGSPQTRSGKLLPNLHTRKIISEAGLFGLDGELICGSPTDPNAMQLAQSAFSSIHKSPDFTFYIFDNWTRGPSPYHEWVYQAPWLRSGLPSFCHIIEQALISTPEQLSDFIKTCLTSGYEGAIVRSPNSPYKHGRATWKQGWMLKAKKFTYEEGTLVQCLEAYGNDNDLEISELGYSKRSGKAEGKYPKGTLGSFLVFTDGATFQIGTGPLTMGERQDIWNNQASYAGRTITFKHFAQSGVRNKPRHGQFISFRSEADL
jgi:DNA ligase-1